MIVHDRDSTNIGKKREENMKDRLRVGRKEGKKEERIV